MRRCARAAAAGVTAAIMGALWMVGCASLGVVRSTVDRVDLAMPAQCSSRFVAHPLPHTTVATTRPPTFFDSNGAGVALADLDDGSHIDIVLAGLQTPPTILWNRGELAFDVVSLPAKRTRAVNAVDVDGDGALDLVFTHSNGLPSLWRGAGQERSFARAEDAEFAAWFPIYAMAWADLGGDAHPDMAGASYDGELGNLNDGLVVGGGVFYFENVGGQMEHLRLGRDSQSLAVALLDIDQDGRRDIIVGNDFALAD